MIIISIIFSIIAEKEGLIKQNIIDNYLNDSIIII